MNATFFINSILFGIALAMDAFSVSLAQGMNNSKMKSSVMLSMAGTFGFFQIIMPLAGWWCVHTIAEAFEAFQKFIPWIALLLLLYIGGKMLVEGIRGSGEESSQTITFSYLMIMGVATSIDALSVGFTIADYTWDLALVESLIIGIVTFIICIGGVRLGKVCGDKLAGKEGAPSILGGIILILIGIEIFIKGVLF